MKTFKKNLKTVILQSKNQLGFHGQIENAISLMKYASAAEINASLYKRLNEHLKDERDRKLHRDYEEYIHTAIQQERV